MGVDSPPFLLIALFGFGAFLYATQGHGGASFYLAVMALFGVEREVMVPTALMLNLGVAGIYFFTSLLRPGYPYRILLPFLLTAPLFASIGALTPLPRTIFAPLLGASLLWAGFSLWRGRVLKPEEKRSLGFIPLLLLALPVGSVLGFLSGAIGVGGGIFLSPLLLFLRLTTPRETAEVSSGFIVINSLAGLVTHSVIHLPPPSFFLPLLGASLLGGGIGLFMGRYRFSPLLVCRFLSLVLFVASLKIFSVLWG